VVDIPTSEPKMIELIDSELDHVTPLKVSQAVEETIRVAVDVAPSTAPDETIYA